MALNNFQLGEVPDLLPDQVLGASVGSWSVYIFPRERTFDVDVYNENDVPKNLRARFNFEQQPLADFPEFITQLGHMLLLNALPDDWQPTYSERFPQGKNTP